MNKCSKIKEKKVVEKAIPSRYKKAIHILYK